MAKNFKAFCSLLVAVFLLSAAVFSQYESPLTKAKSLPTGLVIPCEDSDLSGIHPYSISTATAKKHYISIPGRFSIMLPQYTHRFTEVSRIIKSEAIRGMAFAWKMKEGDYRITYADRTPFKELMTGEQFLNLTRDALASNSGGESRKILSQREIRVGSNPGREVVQRTSDGTTTIRVFLAGERVYQLIVNIPKSQSANSKAAIGVLDSFTVLSKSEAKAEFDKRIAEATPTALPQRPAMKMVRTDAEIENLRGSVKFINERSVNSATDSEDAKPIHWMKLDFNRTGNLIKKIETERDVDFINIVVYGYVDGDRVDRSNAIDTGPGIPVAMMSVSLSSDGSKESETKYDNRYHEKIKYKYDDQSRLIEIDYYSNDGRFTRRNQYRYRGNEIEYLSYMSNGRLREKLVKLLDERGLEKEVTEYDVKNDTARTRLTHSYTLDAHGNWITRRTTKWFFQNGTPQPIYTFRTITYYQ